ncbi:MAG: hypothetical protein HXY46_02155 [Syntrophaceae bacterium]|nr:hypothetical protein [Syntrophaceae bacterium]
MNRKGSKAKFPILIGILSILSLFGCAGPFRQAKFFVERPYSEPDFNLKGVRIGFLTPSSALGLEEDRWILLNILADTFKEMREDVEVIPPSRILSLINQSGMAEEYNRMIHLYHTSGVFDKTILQKIKKAIGVQFLVHLKLASFNQYAFTRLSTFGLRVIDSQEAKMRIFMQIWDVEGRIVWESSAEGIITQEEFRARPISFNELAKATSRKLIEKLPDHITPSAVSPRR